MQPSFTQTATLPPLDVDCGARQTPLNVAIVIHYGGMMPRVGDSNGNNVLHELPDGKRIDLAILKVAFYSFLRGAPLYMISSEHEFIKENFCPRILADLDELFGYTKLKTAQKDMIRTALKAQAFDSNRQSFIRIRNKVNFLAEVLADEVFKGHHVFHFDANPDQRRVLFDPVGELGPRDGIKLSSFDLVMDTSRSTLYRLSESLARFESMLRNPRQSLRDAPDLRTVAPVSP